MFFLSKSSVFIQDSKKKNPGKKTIFILSKSSVYLGFKEKSGQENMKFTSVFILSKSSVQRKNVGKKIWNLQPCLFWASQVFKEKNLGKKIWNLQPCLFSHPLMPVRIDMTTHNSFFLKRKRRNEIYENPCKLSFYPNFLWCKRCIYLSPCMLSNFARFFLLSANFFFFKIYFFEKFFQEYHHSVKQIGCRSGPT